MKQYVLGFMYTPTRVVLIEKNRPNWQAGFLNGIGGHVEDGESWYQAMVREFREETGAYYEGWKYFAKLKGNFGEVIVYSAEVTDERLDMMSLSTKTDEKIKIIKLADLMQEKMLDSARWLVCMAIEKSEFQASVFYV